jgi:tRNA(fMet)-specific endonuclease VapC
MTTPDLLIDTSILIEHIRQQSKHTTLTRSLTYYGIGAVSVVTIIEYDTGEIHARRSPDFERDFPRLIALPIDESILRRAPHLQATNIAANKKMDLADLLIATTAIRYKLPLLTLNIGDFQHIQNLRLFKVQ